MNDWHRIFVTKQNLKPGDITTLKSKEYHYIKNVLRLVEKDRLVLFNNSDTAFIAEIRGFDSSEAFVKIIEKKIIQNESSIHITLLQGIPGAKKLDWIVQKTTELGISEIIPVTGSRSIKKIPDTKIHRYEKIASEASRQCGRTRIPTIYRPMTLSEYFEEFPPKDETLKIFLSQDGRSTLLRSLLKSDFIKIAYAIGPEGDFSTAEKELLQKKGFQSISLGGRILRSETAAIVVAGIIQYETKNLQFPW